MGVFATLPSLPGRASCSVSMAARARSLRTASACGVVVVFALLSACSVQQLRTSGSLAVMSSVAFSPDGGSIAAARNMDNVVFIYDANTLKRTNVLLGKDEDLASIHYFAKALAYSPDGALLATAGMDESFILWNTTTGRESLRIHIPQLKDAADVAFSLALDLVATAGPGEDVILWRVGEGQPRAVLKGHSAAVTSIAFSPDGKLLASGSADKTVILWSVEAKRQVGAISPLAGPVRSVSFSPDGRMLATACDGEFKLWKLDIGRAPATPLEPTDVPSGVKVPTISIVIEALGCLTGHCGPPFPRPRPWGPAIFSPDGNRIAVKRWDISGSGDFEIIVLDVATRTASARIACQCFGMAFSPDGTRLATAGRPVQLWDVNTGAEIRQAH